MWTRTPPRILVIKARVVTGYMTCPITPPVSPLGTGLEQFQNPYLYPLALSRSSSGGSEANLSQASLPIIDTGNFASPLAARSAALTLQDISGLGHTGSQQGRTRQRPTYGRSTPVLTGPNLSSAAGHPTDLPNGTGIPYVSMPTAANSNSFLLTYTFVATTNSRVLAETTYNLLRWNEVVQFTGAQLELASRVLPGQRPRYKLTLRIREPSGGMLTEVAYAN